VVRKIGVKLIGKIYKGLKITFAQWVKGMDIYLLNFIEQDRNICGKKSLGRVGR